MPQTTLRIGTRKSNLALVQTEMVKAALLAAHPGLTVEVVHIRTRGDKKQGTEHAKISDKKDWVWELELALLANEIDLAVHSGKDVPGVLEAGTLVCSLLPRANAFDCYVAKSGSGMPLRFNELPPGALVGTASLRRSAMLRTLRPDLKIIEHRGNVPTRLAKLESTADLCGIVLACAGLERLGLRTDSCEEFGIDQLLPAMNQGILAGQMREDDAGTATLVKPLQDPVTQRALEAERACAHALGGDCHSAMGVFAEPHEGGLLLRARVLSHQGDKAIGDWITCAFDESSAAGVALARKLLAQGAGELLREM